MLPLTGDEGINNGTEVICELGDSVILRSYHTHHNNHHEHIITIMRGSVKRSLQVAQAIFWEIVLAEQGLFAPRFDRTISQKIALPT